VFSRPTAGGGGFGDPLEREPKLVIEDIKDDYVSIERAAKDYGVVVHTIDAELCEYEVDRSATTALRAKIRAERISNARLDPEIVAERYRSGKLKAFDVIRQHAVILDWGTGALLPESTRQFREVFERRSVAMWAAG
jgi:N-methylhydantoinase B